MEQYFKGQQVHNIKSFDRSMKIQFACPEHPASEWVSKDPYVSSWFPASDSTVDCQCKIPIADWKLTADYTPRPNHR